MKSPDGFTTPYWYQDVSIPQHPEPQGPMHAEVCIVGAGIAGLTAAHLMAAEHKSVIVLDEGSIGSGQTGRTSAHLASAIDDRFVEIERLHGIEAARLAYQSHATAIDTIERICRDHKIECDFARLDGLLSLDASSPPDLLEDELAAARRAGVEDVELLDHGGLDNGPCLRFGSQARFHPLRYLLGVAEALRGKEVAIRTGARVIDVQGADSKKRQPAVVQLSNGAQVTAQHVVVATNTPAPINDWMGIYTKQASYRTYMIGARIPRGAIRDALYWDTADPYHYVRVQASAGAGGEDLLLIGGEDHKTGQLPKDAAAFLKLETWARQRFPVLGEVVYRWSGQVQEPADGVAFIGRALTANDNVYVITGDSGMGLTHGTLGAMLITDLILGRPNPWEKLYDPGRKILNREFLQENANVLGQYTDLVSGGDASDEAQITPGHGAILREGLHKLAVYRDESGQVHRCSALCTHLKCIVQWNPVERTWDCPCHGSRFDPTGRVIMGPAIEDLKGAEGEGL